jgi:hypothetical protein
MHSLLQGYSKSNLPSLQAHFISFPEGKGSYQTITHHLFLDCDQAIGMSKTKNGLGDQVYCSED